VKKAVNNSCTFSRQSDARYNVGDENAGVRFRISIARMNRALTYDTKKKENKKI